MESRSIPGLPSTGSKISRWIAVLSTACGLIGLAHTGAWAQASLASEDRIDEIPVTLKTGERQSFTVLRDASNRNRWYYVPDRPRLYERTFQGRTEPEFSLIKFQGEDPSDREQLIEGGILQFSVSMAIPPEALEALTAQIATKAGVAKERIHLAALPMKKADVHLYTPQKGALLASAPQGPGIAPVFATQKMVFLIETSKLGTDVYDAITQSNTGVPVAVEFTFNGLTPAAGFDVYVDWDQTYRHYSHDEKFRAEASYYGLVGASFEGQWSNVYNTLLTNKCIRVEQTADESFDVAAQEKYLQVILKRINDEIIAETKPPAQVDPAKAKDPSAKGYFGSVGYTTTMKNESDRKRGTERISFKVRHMQERKTIAAGFVGVGAYPEEIRKNLIITVPKGEWTAAYFMLPAVGDGKALNIRQVDMEVKLLKDEKQVESQIVSWKPEVGWVDRQGKPRTSLAFGLLGRARNAAELAPYQFKTKTTITMQPSQLPDVLVLEQTQPAASGESAIATPLASVELLEVNGGELNWRRFDDSSKLLRMNVSLESGDRRYRASLAPIRVNESWQTPPPVYWLVDKSKPLPISAKIQYVLSDGKTVNSTYNGDLREKFDSLFVILTDSDWNGEEL